MDVIFHTLGDIAGIRKKKAFLFKAFWFVTYGAYDVSLILFYHHFFGFFAPPKISRKVSEIDETIVFPGAMFISGNEIFCTLRGIFISGSETFYIPGKTFHPLRDFMGICVKKAIPFQTM
jgi:hypothetical protein